MKEHGCFHVPLQKSCRWQVFAGSLLRLEDPAGKHDGVLPTGVSAETRQMDGCIAGAACQQRIALGRAHEPDQREGYHRFTGTPQSLLCGERRSKVASVVSAGGENGGKRTLRRRSGE